MEVSGTIKGGVVVPDSPIPAPEGTRVKVEIPATGASPGEWAREFAGCVDDMPEDASVSYHQKLYGIPKR